MTLNNRSGAKTASFGVILILWVLIAVVGVSARPLLPVDETRYLSVAWEMWVHHNWLVPHLNGEPYAHKPPLLFWLINASWVVFGVNDFTARLIAPLFAGLNLIMVAVLAKRIWPDKTTIAHVAPMFLVGGTYYAGYGTLTYFDMLQCFFALLGWYGVFVARDGDAKKGWIIAGIAIGLGVLAKGPVILLYVLPAAVFAPLWHKSWSGLSFGGQKAARVGGGSKTASSSGPVTNNVSGTDRGGNTFTGRGAYKRWYAGMGLSVLLGAVIALLWAVPAAVFGGDVYRNAIFWGQTAGRMVDSFAHVEPFYYYLVALPAMLLPWMFWGGLWRSVIGFGWRKDLDAGLRFCLLVAVFLLVAFSLISGKRVHYILPVLPLVSLIFARVIADLPTRRIDQIPLAVFVIILGVAGLAAPFLPGFFDKIPAWVGTLDGWWGAFLLAAGIALVLLQARRVATVGVIAGVNLLLVAMVFMIAAPRLQTDYNMRPMAVYLKSQQQAGHDVAYWGKYHAQFQFLGRLEKPIPVLLAADEVRDWVDAHSNGEIIARRDNPITGSKQPLARFDYKNDHLVIWDAGTVKSDPEGVLAR
ncbi:glycosyltransferase family 39 protein [Thalassospira sp. NFXS8]|uniref:ArnT family glycosyltransferase n=1 Tax=Thalassospira sp. NFXS8 TaxID=2819093 RepID=UPI0032DEB25E